MAGCMFLCKPRDEDRWLRLTDKCLQRLYLLRKLEECANAVSCGVALYFLTFNPNHLLLSVGGNLLEKAKNEFEIRRKNREERRREEEEINTGCWIERCDIFLKKNIIFGWGSPHLCMGVNKAGQMTQVVSHPFWQHFNGVFFFLSHATLSFYYINILITTDTRNMHSSFFPACLQGSDTTLAVVLKPWKVFMIL